MLTQQASTFSSPGKLVLMGEHAVVYGYPAIVVSVNKYIKVNITQNSAKTMYLSASQLDNFKYQKAIADLGKGEIPRAAIFVEKTIALFYRKYKLTSGLNILVISQIKPYWGLGSSSAVVVATIKALALVFGINLSLDEVYKMSRQTVLAVQNLGSGVDVAAAVFTGLIYFNNYGRQIKRLNINGFPSIIVGYSKEKASTAFMLEKVKLKRKQYPKGVNAIFENISSLVGQAKTAINERNWDRLGIYFNFNQDYLEDLGVSTEKLNEMIMASRKSGAYGAKLSGAGGGDCMIAITSPDKEKQVKKAIVSTGGEIIDLQIIESKIS